MNGESEGKVLEIGNTGVYCSQSPFLCEVIFIRSKASVSSPPFEIEGGQIGFETDQLAARYF